MKQKELFSLMIKMILILISLFLSGCLMVGPNYKDPQPMEAKHWVKTNASIKKKHIKNANWWDAFHDETLKSLIYQGYQNNLSLQIAAVRVLQTRALLAQAVGNLYPQQQALMGNYTYNRLGGQSLESVLPQSFVTAMMGFSATWEIDFWGKYRRAILANDAAFLASFAAYDNALITLTADIATTYVSICTTEALIKVTQENINVQAEGLKYSKARFGAGETSLLDVEQAQTELSQTEATIPPLRGQLQRQKDALALLLGTTPDQVDKYLSKKHPIPKAASAIAVGIPREALAKRPDIHQARLEAIAQSESIGAVKANLYPSLSLTGTFAFASNNIPPSQVSQIFSWNNRTITAGPAFNWPILNYGQITNAVRAQDALFQQALLNYMNLVLKAQQEVQDNITQFIEAKKTEQALLAANRAAIKSTQLSLIRYREGESDYTPVLDSERQQLKVQTSLINAQGDIPKALIALYRSLGGGWQIRQCNDIVPEALKKQMAQRTNWGSLLKQRNHQPPATKKQRTRERMIPNW